MKISDLEADPKLQDAVLSIHHACIHTIAMAGRVLKIIENQDGKAFIKAAQLAVQQIPLADQQGQSTLPNNQMEDNDRPKISP